MHLIIKLGITVGVLLSACIVVKILETPPIPKLEEIWWGPRDPSKEDREIRPFKINIPEKVLEDLKFRITNTRSLTPPLEGIQHQYGFNTELLNEILDFWKNAYDWREREKYLNQYNQYKVSIQGLKIHYIHVKPTKAEGKRVLPLLLLHGWPGSVVELYDLIPLLTTAKKDYDFVFEIFAPSLPGFGFSEAATIPGLGDTQMALLFRNFMKRMGYDKFFIHGGDWGASISQAMATMYPQNLLGIHSTMCVSVAPLSIMKIVLASVFPNMIVREEHSHKLYPLSKHLSFLIEETGYFHIQSTKPDTIGVGLNDSPAGLAAYILEKFIGFTDRKLRNEKDGGLDKIYSYTKLLDNVMVYWVTQTITTSSRIYSESINKSKFALNLDSIPTEVPTACARFGNDLYLPEAILKDKFYNLVHASDYDGGHYAALENTEILANDIFLSIDKIEKYIETELNK